MPSPTWTLARPDGVEIGVHAFGNGPPIVLVHGTACDHRVWARVGRRLAADFTVHAVDRRGRGASGDGPDWSLEQDGADVAALVDELDASVPVVGHSLGAIVALEAGLRSTQAGPVVAYEPPIYADAGPGTAAADELERLADEEGAEAAVVAFLREVGYDDEQIDRVREHDELWQATLATAPTLAREARADLAYEVDPDRLGELDRPVLLLAGAASEGSFREGRRALAEALPRAATDTIDAATHAVLYEAPGSFADRIQAFVAEHA